VPQSHRYSLLPQVFVWAFQSDCTAYFLEQRSHFHFFSPCFLQKCFLMPVRSPSALAGLWWTHEGSGHTYAFFRGSLLPRCRSFHGKLWPRRWSCRFWSRWNPLLQISQTKRFVAISVFGDKAITSASGSEKIKNKNTQNPKQGIFIKSLELNIFIICKTWKLWLNKLKVNESVWIYLAFQGGFASVWEEVAEVVVVVRFPKLKNVWMVKDSEAPPWLFYLLRWTEELLRKFFFNYFALFVGLICFLPKEKWWFPFPSLLTKVVLGGTRWRKLKERERQRERGRNYLKRGWYVICTEKY